MKYSLWNKRSKSIIITFVILFIIFEGISIVFKDNLHCDNKKYTKTESSILEIKGGVAEMGMILGASIGTILLIKHRRKYINKMKSTTFYKYSGGQGKNESI